MSEPNSAPAGNPAEESATIRAMRAQVEAANQQAKEARERVEALEAAQVARERAEMAEVDRLKAELAEALKAGEEVGSLRDERGRYQSAFEGLYRDELAAVPEGQREAVERLSMVGEWPERLAALRTARGLLGATPAAPGSAGSTTQPPGAPPPPVAPSEPKRLDPLNPPAWGDVLKPVPTRGTV